MADDCITDKAVFVVGFTTDATHVIIGLPKIALDDLHKGNAIDYDMRRKFGLPMTIQIVAGEVTREEMTQMVYGVGRALGMNIHTVDEIKREH